MRWRFVPDDEPHCVREERRATLERIDAFWRAWQSGDLSGAQVLLGGVDQRLFLEQCSSEARSGEAGWAVCAEAPEADPLREVIFQRAPPGMSRPHAGRPRFAPPPGSPVEIVQMLDLESTRVRVGVGRGHLLEVVMDPTLVVTPEIERAEAPISAEGSLARNCELVVEALVGERLATRWIGSVSVASLPRPGALPVVNHQGGVAHPGWLVGSLVDSAVEGILAGLPEAPCWARDSDEWTLFDVEPSPSEEADFAAQDDVVLASSSCPELLKTFLAGTSVFSGRFSRSGELFLYLKYESAVSEWHARLRERDRMEDTLHAALKRAQLGAVVGTGLGLRYSYIDVALSSVEQAIPIVRDVVTRAELSARCWLLFFDSELADEWIGLRPLTGEPPRASRTT